MRVVAIDARGAPFEDRVAGTQPQACPHIAVAIYAKPGLFHPVERLIGAGVDGMAIRQQFPELLMVGHYNKMVMPDGEQAMRAEFERLLPLIKTGGFIPSVDHQTPPGVSLDNYRIYLRLLNEYTS